MNPQLTHIITDARTTELRRQARSDRLARASSDPAESAPVAVTIRAAYADDASDVARLAQLDGGQRPQTMPVLLAEIDGIVRAALFPDGSAISDPFVLTDGAVELLRLRARQDAGPRRRLRLAQRWNRRRAVRAAYASAGSSSASSRAFG